MAGLLLCLLLMLIETTISQVIADGEFSVRVDNFPKSSSDSSQPQRIYGFYETVPASSTEMVWQSPERAGFGQSVAVLFVAHGCSHSATDFFDKSVECDQCIGLPVERRLVISALQKGFLVVAVSSYDRLGSRCWRFQMDQPRVKLALDLVARREGVDHLPRVAFGASSGGGFVATWASHRPLDFAAVAVQIMGLEPELVGPDFPPSVWWHMPRDAFTAHRVDKVMAQLRRLGRTAIELRCEEHPLTPSFFAEWMPEVDRRTSRELYQALSDGLILGPDGRVAADPRQTDWRRAARSVAAVSSGRMSVEADASGLSELLNAAFASHEMCTGGPQVLASALDFLYTHAAAAAAAAAAAETRRAKPPPRSAGRPGA